jgi:hypothetical protein
VRKEAKKMSNKPMIVGCLVVAIGTAYGALSTGDWPGTAVVRWAWLPATLLGVLGGTLGTALGRLAPRGRGRGLLMTCGLLLLAACVGMLTSGLCMLLMGRGFFVWYAWLLPGLIGCAVLPPCLLVARTAYQAAEARRLSAKDISST